MTTTFYSDWVAMAAKDKERAMSKVKQIIEGIQDPADRMGVIAVFMVAREAHVDMIEVMREKLGTYGYEQFDRLMQDFNEVFGFGEVS
jgi:hypothetical protein